MTAYLALDLSKTSTGFALWHSGLDKPVTGIWQLGSAITSPGTVFLRLHQRMHEHHVVTPLTAVAYEKPRHLDGFNVQSNAEAHFLAVSLAGHVESYCEAKSIRVVNDRNGIGIHQATWRRHFIGKMPRATASAQLKGMAVARCRQLGIDVIRHDAAEAVGILDYLLDCERIMPPWRADEVLRAPLMPA
ncbi:hypothetical protein [Sphingomonas panaciterrae]|uniref:hypothetical protein n=1 Tax=Sphingomonas panaciterrae TaxID=1462999 RepID=UPI002FF337A1